MHIIKSVGVLSIAKIMGLIYGCLGLIFAPFFLLFGLIGIAAGHQGAPFAGAFGLVFALLMPIFYGLLGFITGATAKLVGGFELEMEFRPQTLSAPYPLVPPAGQPT
jgi:hypothetical protein